MARIPPRKSAKLTMRKDGILKRSRTSPEKKALPKGHVDFETILTELSASFVNVSLEEIDLRIEQGLKRLVEWLGVDRSTFGEVAADGAFLSLTHCYAVPGIPGFPATPVLRQFPWLTKTLCRGNVAKFSHPEDLPSEATMEREYCRHQGYTAHLSIPIFVGTSSIFTICVGSFRNERDWSETDIRRVRLVGNLFANAVMRRNVEEEVRNSEKRLREFLETTSAVSWECDPETCWATYVSPQAQTLLGYPIEQWFEQRFWEKRLHPDDRKPTVEKCRKLAVRQDRFELEYRMLSTTGHVVWVHDLVSVVRTPGRPTVLRRFMVDITQRKDAEQKVMEEKQFSDSVIESLPGNFFMLDARGRFVRWNKNFEEAHGYTRQELKGMHVMDGVQSEDRLRLKEAFNTAWEKGSISIQYVALTKDGRHIPSYAQVVRTTIGDNVWLTGVEMDITERKRAEDALRKSEEDFRRMANTAPVMIWRAGPDKLCDFVNQSWLDFTGRTMQQELGNGWLAGVHRGDSERCINTYITAFDAHEEFQMEYRLKRFDGEYRWILDTGIPRIQADGAFAGYIGSAIDISERREKEGALRDLSARLITTQEEERRRIARELHDDINQRLALAATELEQFSGELLGNVPGLAFRAQDMVKRINEIAGGVHALSLALHPAKLEHLGLTAALRALCRDLSQQKSLKIRFHQGRDDVSASGDVALCLYRVAQEALQNVLRHSGGREADVRITKGPEWVELVVEDAGKGFNSAAIRDKDCLGLVSMRERVRLVGGQLIVESSSAGTTVKAVVPATPRLSIDRNAYTVLQER